MQVHILIRGTGEYDGRAEMPQKVFASRDAADLACAALMPESDRKTWANGSTYFDPEWWVVSVEFEP